MNKLHINESQGVSMVSKLFLVDTSAHLESYEALALARTEFDTVRTPNATGWRHFLRLRSLDAAPRDFDVKSAAEMLAQLKWTPQEFIELLKVTQARVGEVPASALPAVYRRLRDQLRHAKNPK